MNKLEESKNLLSVLCLEDVLNDAHLIKEMLLEAGFQVSMDITDSEDEYLSLLKSKTYDIILSDYTLPCCDVHSALKIAMEFQPDAPFICISGTIGEDKAIELLKQGASDYILKDRLSRIPYAVKRALESIDHQKEHRRVQEALQQSHDVLYKLAEQVPGVIYQYRLYPDGSSCFPYSSPGMNEIYEYSSEDVRVDATPVFGRLHPEDVQFISDLIMESARTLEHFHCEFRVVLPLQGLRWRNCDATPERLEDGSTLWHGIIYDTTDRKQVEHELIKAKEKAEESDRLKSAFLANMSHEIRTPMNGIIGFAELLKEPDLTGEEQQKYISIIEKGGVRMLNIINDIISISKVESGHMEVSNSETSLNTLIEFIFSFFKPEADQKGIELFYKKLLPVKDATIKTDSEKVYAVLTNLVKNALKFTKEGSIEIGYTKKENEFEFFVKDTGAGIHLEQKEIIFERFRQGSESLSRNYEGAGLGLAISKAYVEMLGGHIWVESDHGRGSTFYFTIPFAYGEVDKMINKLSESVNEEAPFKNLKILIVEDDEISEMLITKLVGYLGKNVLNARNGLEAIDVCRKNPDIDLILMDIKMPEMDGYEATRQIRKFNKEVIIISQTAFALTDDREKSLAAGCNDYLAKPLRKSTLIETIKKHFQNN